MCQRRFRGWLIVCLLGAGVSLPGAASVPCPSGPDPAVLEEIQARTRILATALDLPVPRWVEVAPVPDSAAGVAFGPVVRLRPAPDLILLATLFHEAGHLGPPRARPVEEAVADLTRRALLSELLAREPGRALSLLPILVPPAVLLAEAVARAGNLRLYVEASLLAAVLWEEAGLAGEATDPAGQALRLARAARLGRTLTSVTTLALAPVGLEARQELLQRFTDGHVLPLLRAALPRAGSRTHQVELLLAAVDGSGTADSWLSFARTSLSGGDADRMLAHDLLALTLPGDAGEVSFLDGWVEIAGTRDDSLSRERARVRRGILLARMGRVEAAAADLMVVLLHGEHLLPAGEAAVHLARSGYLTGGSMGDLLDLSPALSMCGATGTAMKALALGEAGFSAEALLLFPHGRLPSPGWAYTAAWSEALAATGQHEQAAALLRLRAADWRRLKNGRPPAAAALMAAVFSEKDGEAPAAEKAARAVARLDGSPDLLLAEAARRWQQAGKGRKARRAWRRLLARVPASDQADAASRALAGGP